MTKHFRLHVALSSLESPIRLIDVVSAYALAL